jgi:hypothetical protein
VQVVAERELGRGVLGVIDGSVRTGVEGVEDAEASRVFADDPVLEVGSQAATWASRFDTILFVSGEDSFAPSHSMNCSSVSI